MFSIESLISNNKIIFDELDGNDCIVKLDGDIITSLELSIFTDPYGISNLFKELSSYEKAWEGQKSWESIERDFLISVSCSKLGKVFINIIMDKWITTEAKWKISIDLVTEMGQLPEVAKSAERFFE